MTATTTTTTQATDMIAEGGPVLPDLSEATLAAAIEEVLTTTESKKAKKVTCPGSSAYVSYRQEEVSQMSKKGRPAWAIVTCEHCDSVVEAGVWFTDKGAKLNGEIGLAYLPKHTV